MASWPQTSSFSFEWDLNVFINKSTFISAPLHIFRIFYFLYIIIILFNSENTRLSMKVWIECGIPHKLSIATSTQDVSNQKLPFHPKLRRVKFQNQILNQLLMIMLVCLTLYNLNFKKNLHIQHYLGIQSRYTDFGLDRQISYIY